VLANIYLHYTLDLWFEKRNAKSCRGKAHLVHFAGDFVACLQWERDAKRFLSELKDRLVAFDLEAEQNKARILRFGDLAQVLCKREELRRPETFNFLGFSVLQKHTGKEFIMNE
jgi:hypothetical protein